MKNSNTAAKALHDFLYENYGEMSAAVGDGVDGLIVYVTSGKKHMSVIPHEWEGFAVKSKWIGKVKPL